MSPQISPESSDASAVRRKSPASDPELNADVGVVDGVGEVTLYRSYTAVSSDVPTPTKKDVNSDAH